MLHWVEPIVSDYPTTREPRWRCTDTMCVPADCLYLDRHAVAPLGGDDAMVPVVVDLVVVDSQEVAVIVGVKAVPLVVVHLVPPPVSLLVAVRVDPEVVVVDVGIVDVTVDVDMVEHIVVTLVDAEPTDLVVWLTGSRRGRPTVGTGRCAAIRSSWAINNCMFHYY